MKDQPIASQLLLAALAIAPAAYAQNESDTVGNVSGIRLEEPRPLNRFALSYRFGLNLCAQFNNGPSSPLVASPVNPGSVDPSDWTFNYDDGFIAPDDTFPNNNGLTYYWGFQNASQFGEVAPNYISFHRVSSASDTTAGSSEDDTSALGLELSYSREISVTDFGSWGFEAAFGYNAASLDNNGTLTGNVQLLTESFFLGDPPILQPPAPYSGPQSGGNAPVIDAAPGLSSVSQELSTISGTRKLDLDLYGMRLGPYVDLTICPRTHLHLSAGFALGVIDSEFSLMESTATTQGSFEQSVRNHKTGAVFGGYALGQLVTKLNDHWDVFGGVQFQHLSDFNQSAGNRSATLDLKQALFVNAGIGYSF